MVLTKFEEDLNSVTTTDVALLISAFIPIVATLYIIARQPVSSCQLSFKVPLVPWLPGFSILINIYLMIKLDIMTWVRFCIWIAVGKLTNSYKMQGFNFWFLLLGLLIFFSYSIRNSALRKKDSRSSSSLRSEEVNEKFNYIDTQVPLILMQNST